MEKFILEINDFGRINKANLEVNKINIVGGVNASGKSTASKLLYCFLKANSIKRKDYVLPKVVSNLNYLIKYLEYPNGDFEKIPDKLTKENDLTDILRVYDEYEKKLNELYESTDKFQIYYDKIKFINSIITPLKEDNNILFSYVVSSLLSEESIKSLVNTDKTSGLHILEGFIKFYTDSFESIVHNEVKYVLVTKENGVYNLEEKYCQDFHWEDDDFYYLTKGTIERITDVFYIGAVSLFDLDNYINSYLIDEKPIFGYEEHITYLIDNLNTNESDIWINEDLIHFQERFDKIINGTFHNNDLSNFSFYSDVGNIQTVNTSSGIKQIGILQLLLKNNKLKEGVFLIIDEPELNLHPEWQFNFAEVLVLLVKEFNVNLYINSHSPFFIEAIDAFAEFYDMEEDVNYYLTEESEVEGKYNFTKIESNELYKIYNNLGNVYDLINQLRLRKRLNG